RLAVAAGEVLVPGIDAAPGTALRLRIRARDVMLALEPPRGVSALNVLPATVTRLALHDGPMAEIGLDAAGEPLLARVTARSARTLGLAPGLPVYAVVKAIAVGRRDMAPDRAPDTAAEGAPDTAPDTGLGVAAGRMPDRGHAAPSPLPPTDRDPPDG
ncbi:MAG: TOBE domain-containing protein, partial [Pseudomonadota bacterium]